MHDNEVTVIKSPVQGNEETSANHNDGFPWPFAPAPPRRHHSHCCHPRGAHGGGVPCITNRREQGERHEHPEGSHAVGLPFGWLAGMRAGDA